MQEVLYRKASIQKLDVSTNTLRSSWASEAMVRRYDPEIGEHYEVLSHDPEHVDFSLLNRTKFVFCDHDENQQIGEIVPGTARIESDRKTRATIWLSDRSWINRIKNGEDPGVSLGYFHTGIVKRERAEDGLPIIYYSWRPYEVSLLNGKPADSTVGLYRSKFMTKSSIIEEALRLAMSDARPSNTEFTRQALAEDYSIIDDLILPLIEKKPVSKFQQRLNDSASRFSREFAGSHFVRSESLNYRDMIAGNFAAGGAFIQDDMHPAVGPKLNKVSATALGAQRITGLVGNFSAPKITSAPVPKMLSETAAAAAQEFATSQDALKPKRIHAKVVVPRQLIIQTGGGAEQIVRKLLRDAMDVQEDRQVLYGSGADDEVLGVANTPGVGSVLYGGAATHGKVLDHESSLADSNADAGALGWVVSPPTRRKWKDTPVVAGTNRFLMEGSTINDYPAVVSNQLRDTNRSIFGRWDELYILHWYNGVEIIVDAVTAAATAQVIIHAIMYFNVWNPHPQNFCVSADSAAQ